MTNLKHLIWRQLDANRLRNLLCVGAPATLIITRGFANDLGALVDAAIREPEADTRLDEAARLAAEAFAERVTTINPYLPIGAEHLAQLECIYRETLRKIERDGDPRAALRRHHYPALAAWVAALYPPLLRQGLERAPMVRGLVYRQHPAAMQMELLGLEPDLLGGPVLDIGCGSRGSLPQWLRGLAVEAYGIDRHLDFIAPYLEEVDWFTYDFGCTRWAALISNMAFSNHLNYALTQDASQLTAYLDRFAHLLAALRVDGSFYYAPSIPDIEDRLPPEQYQVRRNRRAGGVMVSAVTRLA